MSKAAEYVPIAQKLFDRTTQGKIEWKETYESGVFICALDAGYSFEVSKGRASDGSATRTLKMRSEGDEPIFSIRAFQPDSTSTSENDQIYELLDELYDRARRIALRIDAKVGEVSGILDKM